MQNYNLMNLPLISKVSSLDGHVQLWPIPEPQKRMQQDHHTGQEEATAFAQLDIEWLTYRFQCSEEEVVCSICDILSFASRRGVRVVWPSHWGEKQELIMRGTTSLRGPVEAPADLSLLLENALPILVCEQLNRETRVATALRWFLGWDMEPYVQMKFIRLWIVIEMLAKQYWRKEDEAPKKDIEKVCQYLLHLQLPKIEEVPLEEMCWARNALIHGDPDIAEKSMVEWFAPQVEIYIKELCDFHKLKAAFTGELEHYEPMQADENSATRLAAHCLSRVLEKAFLACFDLRMCWFFQNAKYATTWMP